MTGETLGNRYELLHKLGGGGMAVVYKARDKYLDRTVTIKILRSEYASDDSFISRFRKEAQSVARLSHPHIVNIYDVGTDGDIHYLVMEYIEGENLKNIINKDAPMSPERVIDLASQVCEALRHAHENNIIHRDVKPHNILVTIDGRAKLTDFGIAKEVSATTLTYGDNVMGSVYYLSPEQARGELAGPASDIYSLGVVIYEMLTGTRPFEGDTPIGVAMKHIHETAAPVGEAVPGIPGRLAAAVHKALDKNQENRFKSAGEMVEVLKVSTGKQEKDDDLIFDNNQVVYTVSGEKKKKTNRLFIIAGILMVFIILAGSGIYAFNKYMNTPNIEVPNVVDMTLEKARSELEEKGLKAKVVEKIYSEKEENIVIYQNIGPDNYTVKPGRDIELTVSKGPDMRTVPDLIGKTQASAAAALLREGLVLSVSINKKYSDKVEEGHVIKQSPGKGASIERGSKVKITLSKGPETETMKIPDLIGKDKEEALETLRSQKLEFSIFWESSKQYPKGRVSRQIPGPGDKIEKSSKVKVYLSSGPGPDIQESRVKINESLIPDDGEQHEVRIKVNDVDGNRIVYANSHSHGDKIEKNIKYRGSAKIEVYIDGQLEVSKNVS
ncbi:MAG: PASTA domain-containing protein [Clostridiales bacterium]|nr:PASTA domain-containing protein [Clostridiales bacterium]MCF8022710.1 PASTA domain-containing protein [Clostridiales bacterium]